MSKKKLTREHFANEFKTYEEVEARWFACAAKVVETSRAYREAYVNWITGPEKGKTLRKKAYDEAGKAMQDASREIEETKRGLMVKT